MLTFKQYSKMAEEAIKSMRLPQGDLINLYSPISYALESGGKRLRPILTLMTADAFGVDPEVALPAALSIELYHNFTLLHDDIMDNSTIRRGHQSVMAAFGTNAAILSGDTMFSLALEQLLRLPEEIRSYAVECFNKTAIEVFEGQQLDINFESKMDVSVEEYLKMIRLKTSVLLGGAAKLGAIVAHADSAQADGIYEFAVKLGLAFQIMDDYLDTFGNPEKFGKPIGGDIENCKKTFLLVSALNSARKSELEDALNNPTDRFNRVKTIYEELCIPDMALDTIKRYTADAIQIIDGLNISADAKCCFKSLADSLISRDY